MKNCVWVKPELVVQIEFGEWTTYGHLRHAKFVGLREDKAPVKLYAERRFIEQLALGGWAYS